MLSLGDQCEHCCRIGPGDPERGLPEFTTRTAGRSSPARRNLVDRRMEFRCDFLNSQETIRFTLRPRLLQRSQQGSAVPFDFLQQPKGRTGNIAHAIVASALHTGID
jgi:hypothetical protein